MTLSLWDHHWETNGDDLLSRATAATGLPASQLAPVLRQLAGLLVALLSTAPARLCQQSGWHQQLHQADQLLASPELQPVQAWLAEQLPAEQAALVLPLAVQSLTGELAQLDEMVSLGDEGMHEMLDGQSEFLAGRLSDRELTAAGRPDLIGQAAATIPATNATTPEAGMAELNRILHQQMRQTETANMQPVPNSTTGTQPALSPEQPVHEALDTEHHDAPPSVLRQFLPAMLAVGGIAAIVLTALLSGFLRPHQLDVYRLTETGVIMTPQQVATTQLEKQEVTAGGMASNTPEIYMPKAKAAAASADAAAPDATATAVAPATTAAPPTGAATSPDATTGATAASGTAATGSTGATATTASADSASDGGAADGTVASTTASTGTADAATGTTATVSS